MWGAMADGEWNPGAGFPGSCRGPGAEGPAEDRGSHCRGFRPVRWGEEHDSQDPGGGGKTSPGNRQSSGRGLDGLLGGSVPSSLGPRHRVGSPGVPALPPPQGSGEHGVFGGFAVGGLGGRGGSDG